LLCSVHGSGLQKAKGKAHTSCCGVLTILILADDLTGSQVATGQKGMDMANVCDLKNICAC